MYREICQTNLSEFHPTVWKKLLEVSTKYIHSSLHIAARSTEFWDAGLEGKEEGAAAESENRAVA